MAEHPDDLHELLDSMPSKTPLIRSWVSFFSVVLFVFYEFCSNCFRCFGRFSEIRPQSFRFEVFQSISGRTLLFLVTYFVSLLMFLVLCSCRSGDGAESRAAPPSGVQGLGMGLPDLRSKKKGKQKVSKESHVSESLDKLREQTREAVKGLESVTAPKPGGDDFGKDAMMEDWVKQFEEMTGTQVHC